MSKSANGQMGKRKRGEIEKGDGRREMGEGRGEIETAPLHICSLSPLSISHLSLSLSPLSISLANLLIVLTTTALVCVIIYTRALKLNGSLGWDEATHSKQSYHTTLDLQRGDIIGLLRDSNAQVFYPPVHSWMQGVFFLLVGADTITARSFSLLCFFLLMPVLYAIGHRMELDFRPPRLRKSGAMGLITVALALTAPHVLKYAALAMRELSIMLLYAVLLLVYIYARQTERNRWYLLTGFLAVAITLNKYNYGLIVIAALVVQTCIRAKGQIGKYANTQIRLKANIPSLLSLYLPIIAAMGLWFGISFQEKYERISWFLTQPGLPDRYYWWTARGLLYYPRAMWRDLSLSPIIGVLTFSGYLCSWRDFTKNAAVRVLHIFWAVSYVAFTIHSHKTTRYMMPMLPAYWALGAYGMVQMGKWANGQISKWANQRMSKLANGQMGKRKRGEIEKRDRVRDRDRDREDRARSLSPVSISHLYLPSLSPISISLAYLLICLLAYSLIGLFTYFEVKPSRRMGAEVQTVAETLDFLRAELDMTRPALLIGTFAEFSPHLVEWDFITRRPPVPYNISYEPANWPPGAGYYKVRLAEWIQEHPDWQIVTIAVAPDSPFVTSEYEFYNAWKQKYIREISNRRDYAARAERDFSETGITVRIYEHEKSSGE